MASWRTSSPKPSAAEATFHAGDQAHAERLAGQEARESLSESRWKEEVGHQFGADLYSGSHFSIKNNHFDIKFHLFQQKKPFQICNWFANWRRKLKNAGREPAKKTWGHLIKTYNVSANGNVEQFSICSEDSIWGDDERTPFDIGTYSDQTVLTDQPVGYEVRHDQPHILGFYDPRAEGTVNKLGASYELPNQPPRDAFDGYFSASVFESESNVCSKPIGHYATTINHPANAYYMLPETQEQCFQVNIKWLKTIQTLTW